MKINLYPLNHLAPFHLLGTVAHYYGKNEWHEPPSEMFTTTKSYSKMNIRFKMNKSQVKLNTSYFKPSSTQEELLKCEYNTGEVEQPPSMDPWF